MTLAILAFLRKFWPYLIAGFAAVVLLGAVARWGAEKRAIDAANAKAGAVITAAGERASEGATGAVAGLGERDATRAATERDNRDQILSAPDAKSDAGSAGDVGLAGLCRRPGYSADPRCAGLLKPHPAAAPR